MTHHTQVAVAPKIVDGRRWWVTQVNGVETGDRFTRPAPAVREAILIAAEKAPSTLRVYWPDGRLREVRGYEA